MALHLFGAAYKMDVLPVLLVISTCLVTIIPSTALIPKYTRLMNPREYSDADTAGTAKQEKGSPVWMTTKPLPSAMASSYILDRQPTNQDINSHRIIQDRLQYSNRRSAIKDDDSPDLLLTSFTSLTFIDFAGNADLLTGRTDMGFLATNTFVKEGETHHVETIFNSQKFMPSFSEYQADHSNIVIQTNHELRYFSNYLSPATSIFAVSDHESSKIFNDDPHYSKKLNMYITRSYSVSDNHTCCANCTESNTKMVCFSSIPCRISESVKSLEFRNSNYSKLVKEHNHKFGNETLFDNVTELKLYKLLKQKDIQDFLALFRSLKTIYFHGKTILKCNFTDEKFYSVKSLFETLCIPINVFSNTLNKLACFPNLEEIGIRLYPKKCLKVGYLSRLTFLLNVADLRLVLPKLRSFSYFFYRLFFVPIVEIVLIDRDIYGCDKSHLVRFNFVLSYFWTSIINIRCICPCPLITFRSRYDMFPLLGETEPTGIEINGVERVELFFSVSYLHSCYNTRVNRPFAIIEFAFGSKLQIRRTYRELKMTIDKYNRDITPVLWHIHVNEDFKKSFNLLLSKRNISYILFHEGYLGLVSRAQNVILSSNQLGRMAKYHSLDFEKILYAFKKLQVIDLARNEISQLPEKIFSKSRNLKSIILKFNNLATVRMGHFKQLPKLKTLDLSNNNIKTIGTQLKEIFHFLSLRNMSMMINMSENVFECSCTNYFILLSKTIDHTTFVASSYCELKNGDPVQFISLEDHCERQKILKIQKYSLATTASVIAVALLALVTLWNIRKQKRLTDRFVRKVKHGLSKKEFLIFLSYSSKDGEMTHKQILPEIAKRVIERTGVDKEHICTGDTHFIPGFNIIQEAMRCIDICSVVVFVMTKSFVLSPFCRMEVKEALDQAKPIILIIKGNIDKREMPRIIKNIFNKYSRFHFIRGINGVRVLPSWDLLVSAIFDLAAMEEKDIQVLEQLKNEGEENVRQIEKIEMREVKGN